MLRTLADQVPNPKELASYQMVDGETEEIGPTSLTFRLSILTGAIVCSALVVVQTIKKLKKIDEAEKAARARKSGVAEYKSE